MTDDETCKRDNGASDTAEFASNIDRPEVSSATQALAFRATYDAEGFLDLVETVHGTEWNEAHVYVVRLEPFEWRSFRPVHLKRDFGTDSLIELLTPEKLRQIFAAEQKR